MKNNTPNQPSLIELVEFLIKKIDELDSDLVINQSFSNKENTEKLFDSFLVGVETNDLNYLIDIARSKQARQMKEKHERTHVIIGKLTAYFNVAEFLGLSMPDEYKLLLDNLNKQS